MNKEEIQAGMDESAEVARTDLVTNVKADGTASAVAAWVKRHYKTAGYKRLCRILLDLAE